MGSVGFTFALRRWGEEPAFASCWWWDEPSRGWGSVAFAFMLCWWRDEPSGVGMTVRQCFVHVRVVLVVGRTRRV